MKDPILLHIQRNKLLLQQRMNAACTKEAEQISHKHRCDDYPKRCERISSKTDAAIRKIDNKLKLG